ncbi:MAG TPA: SMP-30/gluconolactonase/LRE family protein [Acidimicrobiales bacterium]|nr:SMP-30/gluconolactonase/LRE family protein [Acidimicrobiales bacterium]
MTFGRVGDLAMVWGESLRWDDRRGRLYAVDCAAQTLHWLDDAGVSTMKLPSLPTGLGLTDGPALVACLDGGLHVVDPDAGTVELLAAYPDGMGARANDGTADGSGNFVTGTLNMGPGPGSVWQWSAAHGWRKLADEMGNVNGPAVIEIDGVATLVCADTVAGAAFAWDYDAGTATVANRRRFADQAALGGVPDGATVDAAGGYWSCVLGVGKLARFTAAGVDRVVDVPMANPSDVAFGGPDLDRLYVTSIALDLGDGRPPTPDAGRVLVADGVGVGRPEPRVVLSG